MDFSKSEQYTLSIRLGTDGFSFSVFSPLNGGESFVEERAVNESLSMTANLKQVFREVEWLHHPYHGVNVLLADKRFTLVPLEFFEDEQSESLFYCNHPRRENELVFHCIPAGCNIVVLFGVDKSVYAFLREQYANVKFYAQVAPFIEYFTAQSRLGDCRKVYVHLRSEAMDIYAYERGHLLLTNFFECRITADRLYYLLYIWKQLGLDQEQDELHLMGELPDKDLLLTELKKYIRQVIAMESVSKLNLQTITLCE